MNKYAIAAYLTMISAIGLSQASLLARQVPWHPEPGIYTNEEQVYFDGEAGRKTPWVGMSVPFADGEKIAMKFVDPFGVKASPPDLMAEQQNHMWEPRGDGKMRLQLRKNGSLILRRARPATCWAAIPKDKPKADGSPDWYFAKDVKLHDQGGRVRVGGIGAGGDTGAPELILRMRNVVWPDNADGTPNTNRPSLVLYVHKPDKPDAAEAYVWADPGAARIGINLRWMQASCTIDALDMPGGATPKTIKQ